MASSSPVREIEEEESTPLLSNPEPGPIHRRSRSVRTNVPEAEVHVYKQGNGLIDVFKTALSGWDQDRIDVREILERYGFKSMYAFSPASGRGMPIRFNPRNGRSLLTFNDGAVISVDGEPKDSMIMPITKILVGVTLITFIIFMIVKEPPEWAKNLKFSGMRVPPWVLAGVVILFARLRKRSRPNLEKYI